MPVDMPLEQLLEYKGSSPKPDDFDEYWARALREMESAPAEVELVPAAFQTPLAECYDLYFTGVGGARIHCKYVKPKHAEPNGPALAIFHGYSVDCGDWSDKALYAAHGITVLAMDCRGQGGLSEDAVPVKGVTLRGHVIRGLDDPDPDKLYYRSVFLDTVRTVRILMELDHVDPQRIGVYGQSQGGALTIACASLEPRVKSIVAVHPFLSDYKRMLQLDISNSAYEELVYFFRAFDPHHLREDEIFGRLGYIDIQNLAPRIAAKVLLVTGFADNICPPSTQFAAYNKIASEKELLVYHEYGHEFYPYLADRVLQTFLKL